MEDYAVMATVRLHEPLATEPGVALIGYCWVLGVRVEFCQIHEMVESHVIDGNVDWSESDISLINVANADRRMSKLLCNPFYRGVWYRSGKVYFADDEEELR